MTAGTPTLGVVPGRPREEATMTVHMSRAEWQAAQYRHTRVDGSPAILHMVDGVTVLEAVEFTDGVEYICINGHRRTDRGRQLSGVFNSPLPKDRYAWECAEEDCHAEAEPVAPGAAS